MNERILFKKLKAGKTITATTTWYRHDRFEGKITIEGNLLARIRTVIRIIFTKKINFYWWEKAK